MAASVACDFLDAHAFLMGSVAPDLLGLPQVAVPQRRCRWPHVFPSLRALVSYRAFVRAWMSILRFYQALHVFARSRSNFDFLFGCAPQRCRAGCGIVVQATSMNLRDGTMG